MKTGEYRWDTPTELRTRCKLGLNLSNTGHKLFVAGKTPMASATLMPDGKTLDIVINVDRVLALTPNKKVETSNEGSLRRMVLVAFAKWSPCIYMGSILCDECPRKNCEDGDMCDMYHGRTGHQNAFEAGWNHEQNTSVNVGTSSIQVDSSDLHTCLTCGHKTCDRQPEDIDPIDCNE